MARPIKRSFTIAGHRTSVALEAEFWRELGMIASRQNVAMHSLIASVDRERNLDTGLASSLRLFVLGDLRARLDAQENSGF